MSAPALPMMPPARIAQVNGIQMAYYEAGPRMTGSKPAIPIVLCHGFPELAFSWRHQIKALSEAGYWVIAPDQRGYGLTERPQAVEAYDMEHLTGDLVGLLDHLGIEKAIFCGHDWGGLLVWQMPLLHPDRTAGVIGLNTPYLPRPPVEPIEAMRQRMGDEMYQVHFQKPGEADSVFNRDARKVFSFLMKKPGGDEVDGAGIAKAKASEQGSAFALVRWLEAYQPEQDTRETFLTEEEFNVFVETFSRTGFTGGINWYRNITRNWERSANLPTEINVPSLMVTADQDAFLPPSMSEGMETYVHDLQRGAIQSSGHWTQQERPDEVNRVFLHWLLLRFPLEVR
ncbi:alpha/beta hydrolase [Pseudomonas luteola]|uniref:alpha/beta fold hydrolase n=1 Tax=Pseudomonas luteola TaxID=47886 RepID=UPI003A847AD4